MQSLPGKKVGNQCSQTVNNGVRSVWIRVDWRVREISTVGARLDAPSPDCAPLAGKKGAAPFLGICDKPRPFKN